MHNCKSLVVPTAALLTAGCAATPTGPMVRAMPPPNKPFEVFGREQSDCEHYASDQVAGAAQGANDRDLGAAAALGVVLGLGVGAATGSGRAASVGAATGGAIGAAVGANQSSYAGYMMAAAPPPPPPPPRR